MNKHQYDTARLTLQTLINAYPDSEYVARAKLTVAESWYQDGSTAGLARRRPSSGISSRFSPTCRSRPRRS